MRILVAVPTFENIYPDTFKSIYDLDRGGHEVEFDFVRGYDCATARNNIVFRAQKMDVDYVLMVDNDVVLPQDALVNLLDGEMEVCLGYYAHRNKENGFDGKTSVCRLGEFNYTDQFPVDELRQLREAGRYKIQIHGGGMGCALIKTNVYSRLKYPWYDWVNYADKGILSEDLYFCEQCKWNNIPIYTDTRVGCGHLFRYIQNV